MSEEHIYARLTDDYIEINIVVRWRWHKIFAEFLWMNEYGDDGVDSPRLAHSESLTQLIFRFCFRFSILFHYLYGQKYSVVAYMVWSRAHARRTHTHIQPPLPWNNSRIKSLRARIVFVVFFFVLVENRKHRYMLLSLILWTRHEWKLTSKMLNSIFEHLSYQSV